MLTERYAQAVAYALQVHASQLRRGTNVPYASHLLGVSSLVLEAGGDQDLAIAALLHDSAEDHGGERRLEEIAARFGDRVAAIVRECSDWLPQPGVAKPPWQERKLAHLERLRSASADSLTVWAADKVNNVRALVVDIERTGVAEMGKFHAPPDRVLWYYRANLELLDNAGVSEALLVPLRDAVGRLGDLIEM